jgi:hypothetical protein
MIKPTVGRIVWFTPSKDDMLKRAFSSHSPPFAAIVTYAWSDTCVNLAVFDPNGSSHGYTSVYLVQDDIPKPESNHCEWMPYQKGQAAKHDQR